MKKHKKWLPLLLACILLLAACGDKETEEPGVIHLTYAVLNEKAANEARAEASRFNKRHRDIQIDVVEYLTEDGRLGRDRLLTEMVAGKIPDIIHLGDNKDLLRDTQKETASRLSYYNLARKGYLENLWPYIESDPELGREGVMEAPLKAAEVDGGLYAVFDKVGIYTAVVAEDLTGSREGWTLEEMLELFQTMPEDAAMYPYWADRDFAFQSAFSYSLEGYIDRDAGTCDFTSDTFKAALEFVRGFPAESVPAYRQDAAHDELCDQIRRGLLMQYPFYIPNPSYVQWLDAYFGHGGQAALLGVPTEDGSAGSFFRLASKPLAMSSSCRHKEAAWEFLRETLLPNYRNLDDMYKYSDSFTCLPVNRSDYDLIMKACRSGKQAAGGMQISGLPLVQLRNTTSKEATRFEELFNKTTRINLYDEEIYDIVYEVAGAYFAGDKTLDEAAQMVQNRVSLYLNEQM